MLDILIVVDDETLASFHLSAFSEDARAWLSVHTEELSEIVYVELADELARKPLRYGHIEQRVRDEVQRRWPDTLFRFEVVYTNVSPS